MNEQEREVIADIFRRLEQVANEPRDAEAERFIAERIREQPYAPYAMAQTIFVQEQALTNLQAQAERLRAELEEARREPRASGGILSSLFGGGATRPEEEPYGRNPGMAPRQASPWGGPSVSRGMQGSGDQQMPAQGPWGNTMGQARGGGFLQGALSTAAGVAGGVMMANVLTNAFGGKSGGTEAAGAEKTALADTPTEGATDDASITNSLYENPEEQDDQAASLDDFGGDGGDGGDWA